MDYHEYKAKRDALKERWKTLWQKRIDDKIRAEGIASDNFIELFIDRGDIIYATRDYKRPSFNEILEKHIPRNMVERVNPHHSTGGIGRFIKEKITKNKAERRKNPYINENNEQKKTQTRKKSLGWLHLKFGMK